MNTSINFRRCFFSHEEFEAGMKQSVFYTNENFSDEYHKHMVAMSHIAECAKIFIFNNWEKVKDWSDLDVKITKADGTVIHYYKYTEPKPKKVSKPSPLEKLGAVVKPPSKKHENWIKKLQEEFKANQNPVTSVSDVVLDSMDGDFSLTINGNEHWWLVDNEVIVIANYIENQLK
jgi:hypothetical protein